MTSLEVTLMRVYGQRAQIWLEELPQRVAGYARKWGLSELTPFKNLSYNYVLSGFQEDRPIVLKLGLLDFQKEARALLAFDGYGGAKVLAQEPGALLLERAEPGFSLKDFFPHKDAQSVEITCQVIRRLHQAPKPEPGLFPPLSHQLRLLDQSWDIPNAVLQKARLLRGALLESTVQEVLLHADLHHENILQNGRAWVVIDPHGAVGDPTYEVCAFIRNPQELVFHDEAARFIETRTRLFADLLGMDPLRIAQWGFVQAVLGWVWSVEDHTDPACFERLTHLLLVNEDRLAIG